MDIDLDLYHYEVRVSTSLLINTPRVPRLRGPQLSIRLISASAPPKVQTVRVFIWGEYPNHLKCRPLWFSGTGRNVQILLAFLTRQ
jgi:hypothetical protein